MGRSVLATFFDVGKVVLDGVEVRTIGRHEHDVMPEFMSNGLSRNATAKKLDVSISAVVKLMQRWQATGSYGRCRVGQRLLCKELWGHWQTITFTGALRINTLHRAHDP